MKFNLNSASNKRAHCLALTLEPVLARLIKAKVRTMLKVGASPDETCKFINSLALPKLSSLDNLLD